MSAPQRRFGLLPTRGLLVVRTTYGWYATPPLGRDPVPLSFAAVNALVRASAGEPLPADDVDLGAATIEAMVATGALVEGAADGVPDRWSARTGTPAIKPMPGSAWVWPALASVGQIVAGCVLVEGVAGRQGLLDDVDLMLFEIMVERDGALVDTIVGEMHQRFGAHHATELEVRTRLARLAEVGAVRWYPATKPASATGDDPAGMTDHGAGDASDHSGSAGLAARLQSQDFPGRTVLRSAWHRWSRRTESGAEPTEFSATAPAGPSSIPPSAAPNAEVAAPSPLYFEDPRVGPRIAGRVPVYAPFQLDVGPPLSLGMLTAHARQAGDGALNDFYEIRRTEDPRSLLADLAARSGPAILLCSNYLWSWEHNRALAHEARRLNPDIVFIHGGPHTPTYPGDCRRFFDDHRDIVHVTVRGEGEQAIVDILTALAGGLPALDLERLDEVSGITYRRPADGEPVTNPDRERITDLDRLPSPYLTGEFDHLTREAFTGVVTLESNRGCPYGCTFCDWGSMTLSRIRKFDLDRLTAEMRWVGQRGMGTWVLADANLGIMARDVEIIDQLVAVRREHGVPTNLGFNVAKNTTKHLTAIMDRLVEAGVGASVSLALQSTDADTLEAVRRTNIDTDHYVGLGASFRRRGLPLQADLMLGLPGQTLESFSRDLQFLMSHEIPARIWITQLLPNSPMNDPEYRDEFAILADETGLVVSSSTFSAADRISMKRVRHAHAVLDRFGLLRHVMRHLQWDHGVEMIAVLQRAVECSRTEPERYPLLNWSMRYFDHFGVPPLGWRSFLMEARRFIVDHFGVPPTPALDTVFALQEFLLPVPGRRFPDTIVLDHDYLAYHRAATETLWTTGRYAPPTRRLEEFGPARFTVYADHLDRCGHGMRIYGNPRNDRVTDEFWMSGHMELDSPLVVNNTDIAGTRRFIGLVDQVEHAAAVTPADAAKPETSPETGTDTEPELLPVPVRLGRSGSEPPTSGR